MSTSQFYLTSSANRSVDTTDIQFLDQLELPVSNNFNLSLLIL